MSYCAHEVRKLPHRGQQYNKGHETLRRYRWAWTASEELTQQKGRMKGQAYGLGYRMEFIKPDLSEANIWWRYQSSARYYANRLARYGCKLYYTSETRSLRSIRVRLPPHFTGHHNWEPGWRGHRNHKTTVANYGTTFKWNKLPKQCSNIFISRHVSVSKLSSRCKEKGWEEEKRNKHQVKCDTRWLLKN